MNVMMIGGGHTKGRFNGRVLKLEDSKMTLSKF